MKIGIIGAGTMGEVITSSLLKKRIVARNQIMISDLDISRLTAMESDYEVQTTMDNQKLLEFADVVLLCVKPQNSPAAMATLKGHFRKDQVLVSIMAGVGLTTIGKATGHDLLVRAMPNIPARIGEGMTAWMASEKVSDQSQMIVKMIFQAFGTEIQVHEEDLIDAATAISGSGPAYIFYFAENLMKSAVMLGFSSGAAHRMVQQTFRGAMNLWHETGEEPQKLRRSVTSKGGTTAAALNSFKASETPEVFHRAFTAAYQRAKQLQAIADGQQPAEPETDEDNGE